jgi:crotonobetainyl-CoA:carnitine CoA-transferase CaiB-like acyl-CoA transferase
VSTSSQSIAERVMTLVGRPDVVDKPWFASGHGRAEHADELDAAVSAWIAERSTDDVVTSFEQANAAVARVLDVAGVMADPQYEAIGTIRTVEDDDLGPVKMQNVLFRLSETPGDIRFTGRAHGADTATVLEEVGVTPEQLAALRERGIV